MTSFNFVLKTKIKKKKMEIYLNVISFFYTSTNINNFDQK